MYRPPSRRIVPTWVLWAVPIIIVILAGYTILAPYTGFKGHPFWDWLELVGISTAIGFVGWIVARRQKERDEAIALEHAQDEALRAYLDQMSNLMIDQKLGNNHELSIEDSVRKVAQARTIAILLALDAEHKRRPLKLVYELGLINRNSNGHKSIIELRNAGLDHANLSELTLRDANLRSADLRATNLSGADLSCSDLALADLRGANLRRANLKGTDLTGANFLPYDAEHPERWSWHNLAQIDNLNQEKLRSGAPTSSPVGRISRYRSQTVTNLREGILEGARLHNAYLAGADLTDADLRDADLSDADLTRAYVTEEQLATCKSLQGTTMPDGTVHD